MANERNISNNPTGKPYCCHIDCNKDATVKIQFADGYEDYTHSCDTHVDEMAKGSVTDIKSL